MRPAIAAALQNRAERMGLYARHRAELETPARALA